MSHLDDNSDELTRELRDRSADVGGHPIDIAAVRRTARGIQQRRRILGGVAAAAVFAVAVPVGVAASHNLGLGQQPAGQPAVTSASSAGPSATVDLTTAGADRGTDPAIAFIDGQTLMMPGGVPLDLRADYIDIARLNGGWIALGMDGNGDFRLNFLDADGIAHDSAATTGESLAINADGSYVAYALQGGLLKVAPTEGFSKSYQLLVDDPGPLTPAGILGDPGTVYYNTGGRDRQAWKDDLDDMNQRVDPFLEITGVAPDGALAGQTSYSDTGSCSQVSNADGSKRWETCDFMLGRFSPDGRHVLASGAYVDGLGGSQITILDAQTGDIIVSYQRPAGSDLFVQGMVWEDDSHVLAVVYEDGTWRILRLDLDGNIETASRDAKADEVSRPFFFSTQP